MKPSQSRRKASHVRSTSIESLEPRKLLNGDVYPTTVSMVPIVRAVASETHANSIGRAWLQFTREGPTTWPINVWYSVRPMSTATPGADYVPLSGWVTIPAGWTSVNLPLVPIDDDIVEDTETVHFELTAGRYNVNPATRFASLFIADNDVVLPVVSISSSDAQGSESGDPFSFTVTRTGSTTSALAVNLTYGGTATGADVTGGLPASVTIPAGQSAVTVTRTPFDDALVEGNENLIITVATSANYTRGATFNQTITIIDNDSVQPTVRPGWWNNEWNYRTAVTFNSGSYARQNKTFVADVNFTTAFQQAGTTGSLITNSIRVVEVDASGLNVINDQVPFQFDAASNYNAASNASGQLSVLAGGNTASNTTRYFHVYFDKSGTFGAAAFNNLVTATDNQTDEGQTAVRIVNQNATYFYQKENGGFSSILDTNGNDWLNFNNTPGSGSAGEYRGIPNAVFPGGGFHAGFVNATTTIVSAGPLRVVLRTDAVINRGQGNQNWSMTWEFFNDYATATVTQSHGTYWFLYEGTPGGSISGTDFVVRSDGTNTLLSQAWTANGGLTSQDNGSWVYFADAGLNRHLYMAEHQADNVVDSYYLMENNMTVFGFGRDGGNSYLTGNGKKFTIGLANNNTYATAAANINGAYRDVTTQILTGAYKFID